jgi:hypothetical protein
MLGSRWTGWAVALLGLAAVTGCELAVTDTLPAFTCVPGASDVCPAGEVCDPVAHTCGRAGSVTATPEAGAQPDGALDADDATVGDSASDAREAADETDGGVPGLDSMADSTPPPVDGGNDSGACHDTGCACVHATDCAGHVCAAEQDVGASLWAAAGTGAAGSGAFCTQACCTSADCPNHGVCFATGVGGNYCVLPQWLPGRSATVGASVGGATCAANADCRSGLCASGACADTCCSNANSASECAVSTTCRIGAFPGMGFDTHSVGVCTPSLASCSGFQCRPCRNSAECGVGQACYYLPIVPTKDIAAACTTADGPGTPGTKCTTDFTCATNFCDMGMLCSDVCFADADCTVDGWRCRPEQVQLASGGSDAVLVCGP